MFEFRKENLIHNLPVRPTKFFGREFEKKLATDLFINKQVRLLTLTGAGGVGKTRLSIEIANNLVNHFKDGIWFIELAPLFDPNLLPDNIAAVLAIPPGQGKTLLEVVLDFLGNKQVLLVIDNCEHLVEGVARLAGELLRNCPGLCIVASSREALSIEGEQTLRVPPLEIPSAQETGKTATNQDFAGNEAVQLFVERARAVNLSFTLTNQNSPAIAEICIRLAGIPLALELAAARVNVLTPELIASRLNESFRLLTGGFRTALPRHQTLRASIDWSYDLLSLSEKVLLRRISVLANGCSLVAAEFVGAGVYPGGEIDSLAVLDLLEQLINKSLLQIQNQQGNISEPRYIMLETIRQYASEKLFEAGERQSTRLKCCEWFMELAEIEGPALYSARREQAVQKIEKDYDNLRAVLGWLQAGPDKGAALIRVKIASALGYFWYLAGYWSEGYSIIEQILQQFDTELNPDTHKSQKAKLLLDAGILAYFLGDFPACKAKLQESTSFCEETGARQYQVFGLSILGNLGMNGVNLIEARPIFEKLEALLDEWNQEINVIWVEAQRCLGWWNLRQEKFVRASDQFEKCLEAGQQMQDNQFIARGFRDLGVLSLATNSYEKARYWLGKSLKVSVKIKNKQYVPDLLVNLAELSRKEKDFPQAVVYLEEGIQICREINYKSTLVVILHNLGLTLLALEKYGQAESYLKDSMVAAKELGNKKLVILALAGIASVKTLAGSLRVAACLFGAAESLRELRGFIIGDSDLQVHEYSIGQLKAQLAEPALVYAWQQGQTLSLENAVDFALAVGEEQELFIAQPRNELEIAPIGSLPFENTKPSDTPLISPPVLFNSDNYPVNLTQRELEVLRLLAEGLTNSQIADKLVLSPRTVHAHVRSILGKLGVNSRAAATRFALKNDLA